MTLSAGSADGHRVPFLTFSQYSSTSLWIAKKSDFIWVNCSVLGSLSFKDSITRGWQPNLTNSPASQCPTALFLFFSAFFTTFSSVFSRFLGRLPELRAEIRTKGPSHLPLSVGQKEFLNSYKRLRNDFFLSGTLKSIFCPFSSDFSAPMGLRAAILGTRFFQEALFMYAGYRPNPSF